MSKVTVTYIFEDSDDGVAIEFKTESNPSFSKNIADWTEAQKAAIWFAEKSAKDFSEEADNIEKENQSCDESCGCPYLKSLESPSINPVNP